MASSSSVPSTSASNEISQSEENTKPVSKSLPHDSIKKKPTTKLNLFKWKLKKSRTPKGNSPKSGEETNETKEEENGRKDAEKKETEKEIQAIKNAIIADFHSIENASNRTETYVNTFKEAQDKFKELETANAKDLRDFKKVVKGLKHRILTQYEKHDAKEEEAWLNQLKATSITNTTVDNAVQQGLMPNLFADPDFERTLHFQDFKAEYNELPYELKLCLLSFSVFPEDVEIKRRAMIYWWIGEGFAPPRKDRPEESKNQQHWKKFDLSWKEDYTPEEWASHYFEKLLDRGYIESAQKKPNPKVDIFKMHPFVRLMVNRIAKDAGFFEFDIHGTVDEEFSKSRRACLLNEKTFLVPKDKKITEGYKDQLLKNLHAILNVDESNLDFKQDSLSKMKHANVMYLGRWQSSGTHHIEVKDTKILGAKKGNFLDGLQNVKHLNFLSLQGISIVTKLPQSILKLRNLTILDIRACHNLEDIPNDIGCLVNLTHLDMSECYLLDQIPKGISKLTKLQVLGGFVISDSGNKGACTLDDLNEFSSLRKLSIHTGLDKFPSEEDLKSLHHLKQLTKLTIAWGRRSTNTWKNISDKANTDKEQTRKNENEEENPKGNQDNDQSDKKYHDQGKNQGRALQIKEKSKKSQEKAIPDRDSLNRDKGKEIQEESIQVGNPITEEATVSTSMPAVCSTDNLEKDVKKTDVKNEQNPNNSLVSRKKGFKERLDCGLLPRKSVSKQSDPDRKPVLPSQLKKLDLQSFPGKTSEWLRPEKLPSLKKLYIRGGKLFDIGHIQDFLKDDVPKKTKWEKVEELRLKFLDELEMDWRELLEMFPKLDYLEKVDCPKLSFFPCDEIGVWTKQKTNS